MNVFSKNTNLFITSLALLLISCISYGQNELAQVCQTTSSEVSLNYFKKHAEELEIAKKAFTQNRSTNSKGDVQSIQDIPIKIHVLRYSNGTGGLNTAELENTFENLNNIFKAININFSIYEDIDFIDDNDLMNFSKGDEKTLEIDHYTSGILNIYFAQYLTNASKSSICGYSENGDNKDIVVVKNNCSINDSTLIHEIGHIFSLVHTHGIDNSQLTTELVDGSNCDTDGDGICDTPADPGLSYQNVDSFCNYTGNATDANGDQFTPDTGNIMSYSLKACRTHFSAEQIIRMYTYFTLEINRFTQPGVIPEIVIEEEEFDKESLTAVKLFPNPVQNGNIYLSSNDIDTSISFRIINPQGQALANGYVQNNEINVNNLPAGSYILQLQNGSSNVTRRFIK
ncbi:zinc-dependent metalloprotease [Algibacter sp. L4_22]|uniref:zinc-dependent metalloprotease n=1 Tax=Algibacter sp. L4_22 TaxID=2942477 RepID=UPI00201B793C|nr:zinc-dependent metalloprotease [Algibacter sp. L4_22]MCL5129726.1 zinc-dependent metalloprotease [Algibacter sp. L4_22]